MDIYKKTPSKNPYSNKQYDMTEPDLRAEIKRILYTEKRGSFYIYRRVRRDGNGIPIMASNVLQNRSAEASYGVNKGMKYLFDDYMVVGYRSEGSTFHETGVVKEYGDSRKDLQTVYLEHDVLYKITNNLRDMPDEYDKIIEPDYDIDGNLVSPLKMREKFDIGSCEPYRLDGQGRVEYYKLNLVSNMDGSILL